MEQQKTAIQVGSHVRVIPHGITGRVINATNEGLMMVSHDHSDTFEWEHYFVEQLELLDETTPEQIVRSLIRQAQHHMECAESILKKLQEMDAPKLLGFASWEDFCWQNFGHNRQYLYRQLHAAQVRAHLYKHVPEADQVQLDTLSESVLRQFKVAEQALWVDIYDSAKRIGGGTITAKTVKQASDTYADVLQHGTVDGVPLSEVVAAGAVDLMVSRNAANSDLHWVVSRAAVHLEILRTGDDHYAYLRFDHDLAEKLQNLEGKQVVLSIGVKDGA